MILSAGVGTLAALKFCQNLADFAFAAGKAFIVLALLAAIAHVVVYSIVELRKSKTSVPNAAVAPSGFDKILEGLKGVLEALAHLPHWVAIFLAGLALLWMAGQRPEACQPPEAPPPPGQPVGK